MPNISVKEPLNINQYLFIMIRILIIFLFPISVFAQPDPYLLNDFRKVNAEALSLAYSADGKMLLAGFNDGSARLIDLGKNEVVLTVKDHWKGVVAVDMDPKGNFFITAGDNTIKVWTIRGVQVHNLKETSTIWSAHLDSSARYLVSGAINKVFKVFDVIEGKKIMDYKDHGDIVMAARFSPDGKLIASASADHSLKIREFESGEILMTLPSHGEDIYALAFSRDGKLLASGSKDKRIRIYNLEEKKFINELKGHMGYVMGVEFSPDGRYLLSCSFDQTIRLWDVETGNMIYSFIDHKLQVTDICFSPDGKSFASASMDKTIKIWDFSPEILVNYFFGDELNEEISRHREFLPRQKGETKSAYDERTVRANELKKGFITKYMEQLENRP